MEQKDTKCMVSCSVGNVTVSLCDGWYVVHVCVHVHVRVGVRVHVRVRVRVHVRVRVRVCVYACVSVFVCMLYIYTIQNSTCTIQEQQLAQ